ncbi:hypothetical protein KI387_015527, partial [Taxus chinensis]
VAIEGGGLRLESFLRNCVRCLLRAFTLLKIGIKFPITFEQSSKKVTLLLQSFFCEATMADTTPAAQADVPLQPSAK